MSQCALVCHGHLFFRATPFFTPISSPQPTPFSTPTWQHFSTRQRIEVYEGLILLPDGAIWTPPVDTGNIRWELADEVCDCSCYWGNRSGCGCYSSNRHVYMAVAYMEPDEPLEDLQVQHPIPLASASSSSHGGVHSLVCLDLRCPPEHVQFYRNPSVCRWFRVWPEVSIMEV